MNSLVLTVTLCVGVVLLLPRIANRTLWRATVTPLASIIGSGFLVIGPILHGSFGAWSPVVMVLLCGGAFLFGAAIRFNIAEIDRNSGRRGPLEHRLELVADWALAFAYVISVAYYLNLFGQFGLSLTPLAGETHAKELTSAVFLVILAIGWLYGFAALERLEQITVGVKLAIIAGLIAGLGWYFLGKLDAGMVQVVSPQVGGWTAVTLVFGLIVTVQGFETSRYLGDSYDAATRIRSMRLAQVIASSIYMVYILFLTFSFDSQDLRTDETAIIDMMAMVAPILPILLVAAALAAQFSAAVADAGGSGGLFHELTGQRMSQRQAYAVLVCAGLAMTWAFDVFQIIAYASRAFALYYALQAAIATAAAFRRGRSLRAVVFGAMTVIGALIFLTGTPVE